MSRPSRWRQNWWASARSAGWPALAALALAAVSLAALSVHAVVRETASRRQVLTDTYRGIADLASASVSERLTAAGNALQSIVNEPGDGLAIVAALGRYEQSQPWVAPIVLLPFLRDAAAESTASSTSTSAVFDAFLASAETEELALKRPATAGPLYAKAHAAASRAEDRLVALNGMGRSALKAGQVVRARESYRSLVSTANSIDPVQARWATLAWSQLVDCSRRLADTSGESADAIAFYRQAIDFRYVLDQDTADFYLEMSRKAVDRAGPHFNADQQATVRLSHARAAQLAAVDEPLRQAVRGDRGAGVLVMRGRTAGAAIVLGSAAVGSVFQAALDGGAASAAGFAVVDSTRARLWSSAGEVPADAASASLPLAPFPDWRVVAFPRSGSLAAEASRDIRRYAFWLVLVFGTVCVALLLAARSLRREQALSRMRAEFVSGVSHELKTPLSLIRMFAESLREGWIDDARRPEYYEVITRESERLTGLIDNVLDFSRLDSGTRQYRFASTDLRELIVGLLDRYALHLKAADVELVRCLPAGAVRAQVDREAIEQTLLNLLSNAVKYMGAPGRMPRTVTVSLEPSGDRAVLRVRDTGVGMSKEHRSRIFERFYRADDEQVRAVAGSGLGLTIVEAHVLAHAGTIDVESAPGKGSTFTIALPLVAEAAAR